MKKRKNGVGIRVELISSSISNNIKKKAGLTAGRWPAYYYHYVCMYYSILIRLRFKV